MQWLARFTKTTYPSSITIPSFANNQAAHFYLEGNHETFHKNRRNLLQLVRSAPRRETLFRVGSGDEPPRSARESEYCCRSDRRPHGLGAMEGKQIDTAITMLFFDFEGIGDGGTSPLFLPFLKHRVVWPSLLG